MASLVGRDPSTEELYSILNGLPAVKTEFNNVMIRLKRRYVRFDAGAVSRRVLMGNWCVTDNWLARKYARRRRWSSYEHW